MLSRFVLSAGIIEPGKNPWATTTAEVGLLTTRFERTSPCASPVRLSSSFKGVERSSDGRPGETSCVRPAEGCRGGEEPRLGAGATDPVATALNFRFTGLFDQAAAASNFPISTSGKSILARFAKNLDGKCSSENCTVPWFGHWIDAWPANSPAGPAKRNGEESRRHPELLVALP